jgi:four helix bundle protein
MRDFKKLDIWKDGITLAREVYILAKNLPDEEKYGLKSQICRASVSISSNIAEGCGSSSQLEYKRFLEFSL